MVRSSHFFKSLGYIGKHSLTRTKITLLTARYATQSNHVGTFWILTYTHQIITLPKNLLIVDYSLGHTGSVHNAWAFQSTWTFKNHDEIFGPGEWMWANSAYTPETWSIAPFKKPANGQLMADQRTYNY
jgi:hypothetical protein